ncbi:hypothetical protein BH23CHL1_BH23CHL1_05980 [soil metagenome]
METEPHTAFRDLLRHARRDAELTQEELAERAGVSARTISDLERGVIRAPRRDTLAMLASALDLSSADRIEWERARHRLATRPASSDARTAPATRQSALHLPVPLTNFIGREREIIGVAELLRRPEVRLVTLTGVGGVGKTRLALAAAREMSSSYPDGIWFVNLAPLKRPELVLPTIATTLGLTVSSQQTPLQMVVSALRNMVSLLILDNVEQVAASASDIKDVVDACSNVTILATSRMPLHIQCEREYPLEPFDLPDLARETEVDDIRQLPAVVLFAARAQAVKPEFQLTPDNTWAVAEICQRVDGLPLAIELAAARVRLLPPPAMLQHLEQRLPFLVGGTRDGPARHHALYAAIQWSYDLVSPEQQRLFRAFSAYVGGWTLDSAAVVAASDNTVVLLRGLESLIEQNFVRAREQPDGSARYAMLETIREFGLEQLASSGEGDSVRWLHANYFLSLADQAAPWVEDGDQRWLDRLDPERENLRAALAWLTGRGEVQLCLRLVGDLRGFWFHRGSLSDGWAQLEAVLALPGAAVASSARAYALAAAGVVAIWRGDAAASIPRNTEALAICQALGERAAQPWLVVAQGIAAARLGDESRAIEYWEQSLVLARDVGDRKNAARSLANISALTVDPQDADRRQAMLEEALALARAAGHPATIHLCLSGLVRCVFDRGNYRQAAVRLQETLAISASSGWQWQLAEQLVAVARLAQATGQHASAACVIGAHDALRARAGMLLSPPLRAQHDQFVLEVRAAMAVDTYTAARTAGEAIPLEEAIAVATNVLAIIAEPDSQTITQPESAQP